jgi:hypothetical protein
MGPSPLSFISENGIIYRYPDPGNIIAPPEAGGNPEKPAEVKMLFNRNGL